MSKSFFLFAVVLLWGAPFQKPALIASELPELVIYATDSFMASGGLGPAIIPIFEKKQGCKVRVLSSGDGVQVVTRLELDGKRKKFPAQLVLGLDLQTAEIAKPWLQSWGGWTPVGYSNLVEIALRQKKPGFLPYDYGVFALMMDRKGMEDFKLKAPVGGVFSLKELLEPQWKRNLILEDPRVSTPGTAFLLYTAEVFQGELWTEFWTKFRNQWLTLTPGWSSAYGLFLKKEAPLVWSYVTSQAYHQEMGDHSQRYRALLFQEGQPYQVEGAALIRGTESALARKFLDFLISPEVQARIPQKAWMMPVLKHTPIPESFRDLPQPLKWVETPVDPTKVTKLLSRWKEIVGRSF